MMQHMLVTIEGAGSDHTKRQPRSPAQSFLSVSTIEAAMDAIRSGLCFGWLPVYRVQQFLESKELVPLHMPIGGKREVRLNLVFKDANLGSREVNALAGLLGMSRDPEMI